MANNVRASLHAGLTADVNAAVAANSGLRLMGYSVREGAGSTAQFSIVNGVTGNATPKVVFVALAANAVDGKWYGPDGIVCPLGLSVDVTAGDVDLVIYHKLETVT